MHSIRFARRFHIFFFSFRTHEVNRRRRLRSGWLAGWMAETSGQEKRFNIFLRALEFELIESNVSAITIQPERY